MSLSIQIDQPNAKGVMRIHLDGSLDGATASKLDETLQKELTEPIQLLVFDMKHLTYISSAGIRSILIALKKVKALGGKVALSNRQPPIVKVFEIMLALPDLKLFANQKELDSYLDKMQLKASM